MSHSCSWNSMAGTFTPYPRSTDRTTATYHASRECLRDPGATEDDNEALVCLLVHEGDGRVPALGAVLAGPAAAGYAAAGPAAAGYAVAEVGGDDARVLAHDVRQAFGDHLAELEHDHAVADAQHQPHVVLDQQHRLALIGQGAQPGAEFGAFPRVQAGGGLVQAQQPGFRG